ncbi:MAG: M23 family metallopeptidase [Tepidiformaceae bacterium]
MTAAPGGKPLKRRAFIAGAAGLLAGSPLLLLAPRGEGRRVLPAPAVVSAVEPQAVPTRLALSGVARDGPPPQLLASTGTVQQGGALLVTVTSALAGRATFLGREIELVPTGEQIDGLSGVGVGDSPGSTLLTAEFTDLQGQPRVLSRPVRVVRTDWDVEYIIIPPPPPPDPDAPPPPPPPPSEEPLLPRLYARRTERRWTPGWAAPLDLPLNVTGLFGTQRSFDGGPVGGHHGGTDFGANAGSNIYATNAGVVVLSGLYRIRGNVVMVDHGSGVLSLYGHMVDRAVSTGDVVSNGQVLGYVGSTGLSTGAHLHWEMGVMGVLVDGLRWLDGSQGF